MKRIVVAIVLILIILFLAQNITHQIKGSTLPANLFFTGHNLSELEEIILNHYRDRLGAGKSSPAELGDFEIETTYTDLNQDGNKDLIVILESGTTCGSGGCLASIFMHAENTFEPLHFEYAVKEIEVLDTYTEGMRDLRINHDTERRLVWNKFIYVLETI